jgi:subtilisin family serine protease
VLAALVILGALTAPAAAQVKPEDPPRERTQFRPSELLVRFLPGTPETQRAQMRARHRLEKIRDVALSGLELARIADGYAPPDKAGAVAKERSVRYAEPNFLWYPTEVIPNDEEFPELWGLHNTGQTGGTPDADIDAPEAWEVASGSENLVVAVIDTGTDISHPDLQANVWVNTAEAAGTSGVDDDGNGFVDDINGWDFFGDNNSVFDHWQDDEHGTHVSGTIAAVMGNGLNVVGVSQSKIMPVKFLGPSGGSTADAIDSLDYALEMGAKLSNNSWGGGPFSQALYDKIGEANTAGHLFVAAAGNAGSNNDSNASYPCSYDQPNIICVAATDHNDALASFSNYGATTVDVGAPGVSILSTTPKTGKAVLVAPGGGRNYFSAWQSFGLEGIIDPADRQALVLAALTWMGVAISDPVLVVDDDEGASFQTAYTNTLAALGYTNVTTYTVPTGGSPSSRIGPSASTMAGYEVVFWFTGDDYDSTLLSTDQSNLTTYLDGGGKVMLFGVDIGFDLGANNSLLKNKLLGDYIADRDARIRPRGVASTPYATVPLLELDPANGGGGQYWSSFIKARAGAATALETYTEKFSGTSMATPHVSGAAAQVFAFYPGIGHLAAKSRILDGGDPKSSLDGKTVSGKRLNLAGALETSGALVLSDVSVSPEVLSPNGDLTADTTTLSWAQNEPADVTVTVTPKFFTTPVRTAVLDGRSSGSQSWVWDGKNDSASPVPDGFYDLKIQATDVLGNVASATAAVRVEGVTQGDWVGSYGSDGWALAAWNGSSDLVFLPQAALVIEQGSRYRWTASTTEARALESPDETERRAATFYHTTQLRLRLDFAGAYTGNLHLYMVDWDSTARRQAVTVDDGSDPQTINITSPFDQGAWTHFPVSVLAGGSVTITVNRLAGGNAVISGIFLGDAPAPPAYDQAPQGDWVGNFGSDGYALGAWNGTGSGDDLAVLTNAALTLEQGLRYRWASSTTDVRALESPDESERRATTWYHSTQIRLRLDFAGAYTGNLHLYMVDWDSTARRQAVTVDDGSDPQTINITSPFDQGAWTHFPVSVTAGASVTITVNRLAGGNAVISGIFLGAGA